MLFHICFYLSVLIKCITDRSSDRSVTVYWNSLKVLYTEIKEIYDTLFYFFTDIRVVMNLMTITGE